VKIANKWDLGFHLPTNKLNQVRERRLGQWWRWAIAAEACGTTGGGGLPVAGSSSPCRNSREGKTEQGN